MANRMISQREARRLQKKVEALQGILLGQRRRFSADWIGTEIHREDMTAVGVKAFQTAQKLGHGVVALTTDNLIVRFVALPHPSEDV